MIFRESFKGTVKSINMSKSTIEESRVYQYITLPVSGNYTVTAHDIVDGTIITSPSVVYPQVLEYITYFFITNSMFVLNIQFNLMFIVLIAYYQLSPFDHYIVV